jgi:hypothetical protein
MKNKLIILAAISSALFATLQDTTAQESVEAPYKITLVEVNPDGSVDITVAGTAGGYCEVETSFDLVTWYPFTELIFEVEESLQVHQSAPASKRPLAKQFYRVKWLDP